MAQAHFVSRANKNIYTNGKYVSYISKKGKQKGKRLERLDVTVPENKKDTILIHKGESYYWYQFKGGNKQYSKEKPKRSRLTRSGYLSQLYDLQDRLNDLASVDTADDFKTDLEDIRDDIEALKQECEESLERMPESLQESSSSGELLKERIETLEGAYDELDSIDTDYDEPDEEDLRQEAIEELGDPDDFEEDDESDGKEKEDLQNKVLDRTSELKEEKLQEWLQEKYDEISGIDLG